MVCDTPYLQNEFGGPRFFYVFNLILSFSTCSQSFKKICAWERLGANVLKGASVLLPTLGSYVSGKYSLQKIRIEVKPPCNGHL